MRVLAVDYGEARIGLAVSDELGILASPLEAYRRTEGIKRDARAIAEKAEELGAEEIIVGYPRNMNGEPGESAEAAAAFGERIGRYTKLKVTMWDERLTTVEASRRLRETGMDSRKARGYVDSQAAAVLLDSFLRARKERR